MASIRFGLTLTAAVLAAPAFAQEPVATATSPAATFAARPAGDRPFEPLPADAPLLPGTLLVTLPDAALVSKNGAVAVQSLADYDGRSPLPVLETAFTLNPPAAADLDLTLDRGRVDLTNRKPAGAAAVVVRFAGQQWKVSLADPGTRVAVELCGRWPSGSRFKPAAGADAPPAPAASLLLLVLAGSADVDVGGLTFALKSPPGPAQLEWSGGAANPVPTRLDKLPAWAEPEANLSPAGRKVAAAVEKFRVARAAQPADAVQAFLDSADPVEQRVALITLGATDDLEALAKGLSEAKTAEEWDFGVTVLRHWVGRCGGQDQKLYKFLQDARGYSPGQAAILLRLLFGFTAEELAQPETYEVLIEYLLHDRPGIRNTAAWHLVRLVPAGKTIAFKANASPAERKACYDAWKKLVPSGELPPRTGS